MKLSLGSKNRDEGDSLWMRCDACESIVYKQVVQERKQSCPECGFHFRLSAEDRIAMTCDEGTFSELFDNIESVDPLNFKAKKTYKDKFDRAVKKTGRRSAAIVGTGEINGITSVVTIIDANFIMGSMGSVVGEKIALSAEYARENKLPLIIISGSGGGARMEEGLLSLFQMAKTSAAIRRFQDEGGTYITVLTNATMGGSMASWASLGDIIIAEPQALLGFAGPRVIDPDRSPGTPRRFPDLRVSARSRLHRPDLPAYRAEGSPLPLPSLCRSFTAGIRPEGNAHGSQDRDDPQGRRSRQQSLIARHQTPKQRSARWRFFAFRANC